MQLVCASLLSLVLFYGQAGSIGYDVHSKRYCLPGPFGNGGSFILGHATCQGGRICQGGDSVFCSPPATGGGSSSNNGKGQMGACLSGGSSCCGKSSYCDGAAEENQCCPGAGDGGGGACFNQGVSKCCPSGIVPINSAEC